MIINQEKIYDIFLKYKTIESILIKDIVNSFDDNSTDSHSSPQNILTVAEKCWLLLNRFTLSGYAQNYFGAGVATILDIDGQNLTDGLDKQVQLGLVEGGVFSDANEMTLHVINNLEKSDKYMDMFMSETGWTIDDFQKFKTAIETHTVFPKVNDVAWKLNFYSQLAYLESIKTDSDEEYDTDDAINDLRRSQYTYIKFKDQYNLLRQEIDLANLPAFFANNNYTSQDDYHETLADILYGFYIYYMVYDENWQHNLFDTYLAQLFEGPGQKTAFLNFVKSLDGKFAKYSMIFFAALRKHSQQENLPMPIEFSSVMRTDELTDIDEELRKESRCDVVTEYACRFNHIEETQREIFNKIIKGSLSVDNIKIPFKDGISHKTKKPLKRGGARVAYMLIQYIQNPLSLKNKALWATDAYFKSIVKQIGFEYGNIRDIGYKLEEWKDIQDGLIECEKVLNNGKSELENIINNEL